MIIFLMTIFLFLGLLLGIPVALHLCFTGLFFAFLGVQMEYFDPIIIHAIPNRLFGIIDNQLLISVPLFVLMGNTLEKTKIAENLLSVMGKCLNPIHGGLALSVLLVGVLMAASTGIVGATVVTMTLIALPSLLNHGYSQKLSTGTIVAAGTLGQLIPPSIALILLADVLATAYQQAQLSMGKFFLETISVADLFAAAIFPSILLVLLYAVYIIMSSDRSIKKDHIEYNYDLLKELIHALLPPILLIILVLGSILKGIATPTEAAAFGSSGALIIAIFKRRLSFSLVQEILEETLFITCMVFFILIGASLFSLTFRALGGDSYLEHILQMLPGGVYSQLVFVMLTVFLLGFMLDFIEIIFIVVPIVAPILFKQGISPVWFGILLGVNLQTSFLTPPFGFALFYLRGAAPSTVETKEIYKGIIPFIGIQLILITILIIFPQLATWLPHTLRP